MSLQRVPEREREEEEERVKTKREREEQRGSEREIVEVGEDEWAEVKGRV
jgi:hypothetical protein